MAPMLVRASMPTTLPPLLCSASGEHPQGFVGGANPAYTLALFCALESRCSFRCSFAASCAADTEYALILLTHSAASSSRFCWPREARSRRAALMVCRA